MSINNKIEILREKLYKELNKKDATQKEVLKISQELDILITKYYLS